MPRFSEKKQENKHKIIVCRTNDEVNADMAGTWCGEHDLVCRPADQRDPLFPKDAGALAVDLNHLGCTPAERVGAEQPQIHLVDQGGRLKGLVRPLIEDRRRASSACFRWMEHAILKAFQLRLGREKNSRLFLLTAR